VFPFDAYLKDREPHKPAIAIEVRTGDEPIVVEARQGTVRTRRGTVEKPDAVLEGRPGLILGLLAGRFDLAEARKRGLLFKGNPKVLSRVIAAPDFQK
jgi:hypothetical protein